MMAICSVRGGAAPLCGARMRTQAMCAAKKAQAMARVTGAGGLPGRKE
jgi:hypothetical protein